MTAYKVAGLQDLSLDVMVDPNAKELKFIKKQCEVKVSPRPVSVLALPCPVKVLADIYTLTIRGKCL